MYNGCATGALAVWWVQLLSQWLSIRCKRLSDQPYQINFLDTLNPTEPQVSLMLASLLSWKSDGNRWPLLECLLKVLHIPHQPRTPVITAEKERIDVMVKDAGYAIIFENKIKGAQWQHNQLARYVGRLEEEGYNTVSRPLYIVIIPSPGLNASSEDLSYIDDHVWQFADRDIRSVVAPNVRILSTMISDWIAMSLPDVPEKEVYLRAAMVQFADYTNGLYTMRRDDQLMNELTKLSYESLMSMASRGGDLTLGKINEIVRAVSDMSNEIITRTQWALKLEVFRSQLQKSVGSLETVNITDRDDSRPIYIFRQINSELFLSLMFDPEEQGKLTWTIGTHQSKSIMSLGDIDYLLRKASIRFFSSDNPLYLRYQYIELDDDVAGTFLDVLDALKSLH